MSDRIGAAAGQVWGYLKANGAADAKQVQKGAALDAALTHQALGWLAREGKLNIDRTSKQVKFSLTEP